MARGHFYTPPPTFIGGRQPYAPALGQPQSGEVPDQPPPLRRQWFDSVHAQHRDEQWTLIYTASIAPILAVPATIDNPPPSSYATLHSIVRQWGQAPYLPPALKGTGAFSIAVVPDNPPTRSYANLNLIRAQWEPRKWWPLPSLVQQVQPAPPDTTPDAFSFTDQSGVALSTTITSAPITVSGIDSAATITVTGGTYDINGSGSFTSSSGTVNNGDTVRARHTSSASYSTATDTVVTIGGVSDTFTSTTITASTEFDVIVPYLIGSTQAPAEFAIRQIYCVPNVIGSGGTVTAQTPEAFTFVLRGTTISITMGGPVNNAPGGRRRGQVPYNSGIN